MRRAAIRTLGAEPVLYMRDDAIDLLPRMLAVARKIATPAQ
jgi:hypothetical protein